MPGGRAIAGAGALLATFLAATLITLPAGASSPRRAYTPAGKAAAKAIVLKRSDLPKGWKVESPEGGSGGGTTCPSFDPDQSDLTSVGRVETGFASGDGLSRVLSVASVFKTAAQAQTSWNRVVRPAMLKCLAQAFEQGASDKKTKTTVLSSGALSLPLSAPRRKAFRIVADVFTQGQHVKAYLDVILQGGAQADTVLLVTSVLVPPQTAFEWALAGTVARRLG